MLIAVLRIANTLTKVVGSVHLVINAFIYTLYQMVLKQTLVHLSVSVVMPIPILISYK